MSAKVSLTIPPPRTPAVISEEMEDLCRIEALIKNHQQDSAATRFRWRSLQKRKGALQEELCASNLLGSE